MMRRIAIVLGAALGFFVACRPGEGDYCLCPDECRRGLVCAQAGTIINACISPSGNDEPGRCIEQDGVPTDMDDVFDDTAAPDYHDVGGKRDFEPELPSDDSTGTTAASSGSDSSTTGSTGTDSTGATGSTSGGTSTGGSTSDGSAAP